MNAHYTTKELSKSTWFDFEKLFQKYNGVQAGCWCMFYQRPRPLSGLTLGQRERRNHKDKELLVKRGLAHGIIVYSNRDPVGWCQYGPKEELTRIDNGRNYPKLKLDQGRKKEKKIWRITCFFVDKEHRRKGVAKLALKAALISIKERWGGGIVEAFPATHTKAVAVWFGSVSMFQKEGFRKVAVLGRSNIVMRRSI
jgi:GNAT superfamily N-acetyltransferase